MNWPTLNWFLGTFGLQTAAFLLVRRTKLIRVKSYLLSGTWRALKKCLLLTLLLSWLLPSWKCAKPKAMWLFCPKNHGCFLNYRKEMDGNSWRGREPNRHRGCNYRTFRGSSLWDDLAMRLSYSQLSSQRANVFLCRNRKSSPSTLQYGCLEKCGNFFSVKRPRDCLDLNFPRSWPWDNIFLEGGDPRNTVR